MAYIGLPPKANFTSGLLDRFTSTTGTTVTLTHDISSENDIVVFVNFVKQDSTTYSVGGTGNKTLTLGGTLVSSDIVEVHYLNIVGQTVNPSANSVGSSQLTADSITGQTAETSIATDDTVLIHDTSAGALRKMTRANFVSGVGGANTPAFEARTSSAQSLSGGSATLMQFDTEIFDTDNTYTNSSTFKFTPGVAGKYFIHSSVAVDDMDDAESVIIYLYKNGSSVVLTHGVLGVNFQANNGNVCYASLTAIVDANTTDYYQIYVKQNDSVTNPTRTEYGNIFMGYRIIT